MAGGVSVQDEAAIFGGGAPEPAAPQAPPPIPDQLEPPPTERTPDDAAVSEAIRGLQREGGRHAPQTTPRIPATPLQAPRQDDQQPPQNLDPQGLLRAMLDERERRQDLARRLERYERQEQEAKAREQVPPIEQRLFEQPRQVLDEVRKEIYEQAIAPLEARLTQLTVQQDMNLASIRHADVWQDAWGSWFESVQGGQNAPLYFRVMNAASPGEELVAWFNEERVRREVGNDLGSYRERLRAELMAELGMAGGQPQPAPAPQRDVPRREDGRFAPRHEVRLPSATSRMGAANSRGNDEALDGSEDAIFDAARPTRGR